MPPDGSRAPNLSMYDLVAFDQIQQGGKHKWLEPNSVLLRAIPVVATVYQVVKVLLTFEVSPHEHQTFSDVFMLLSDYRYQSVNHLFYRNGRAGR